MSQTTATTTTNTDAFIKQYKQLANIPSITGGLFLNQGNTLQVTYKQRDLQNNKYKSLSKTLVKTLPSNDFVKVGQVQELPENVALTSVSPSQKYTLYMKRIAGKDASSDTYNVEIWDADQCLVQFVSDKHGRVSNDGNISVYLYCI